MPDPARGVFETLLVLGGRPVELDRHLDRLAASVAALYDETLPNDARGLVVEGARALDTGRLRLTLVPSEDTLSAAVVTAAVDPEQVLPGWERAIVLDPVAVPGGLGDHKWADRDLLAALEPEPAVRVALLHDVDGTVLEGSRGNVFAVRGGRLTTPPLDGRILPGIARAVALEEARALGLEVAEAPLTLGALAAADEVFTTGSVRGLEPVRSLLALRDWDPGTVGPVVAERLRLRWSA